MMIAFLRDILAFADQVIPSPIALFRAYQFSPADLAHPRLAQGYSPWSSNNNDATILSTIDILSYNINNVAARSPTRTRQILRAIFSSGADVILLQETNPAWEDLLREDATALQFRYSHFHHPGANDRAAGGIAILSQYPLENIKVLDFTKVIDGSVFPTLTCAVKVPIQIDCMGASRSNPTITINIANVHLRPPVELDGSAWLDTARKTEPIRINEAKELIQSTAASVKSQLATKGIESEQHALNIIAGDFNEGDDAGSLSYLASLGYTDALQQHVPKRKETHVWPFMKNMWTLRKRLDHILWYHCPLAVTHNDRKMLEYDIGLQCLSCGVITGYENGASDHQPVLARFAFCRKD